MSKAVVAAVASLTLIVPGAAWAQSFITSSADPSLSGATLENFNSTSAGAYVNLTSGNVSLSGNDTLYIENTHAGGYNATGNYLANRSDGFTVLTLDFASPVSAFGFNWGASNESWVLSAFDSSNSLIASYSVPESQFSNAGDFYGIAANGIARGVLTQTSFGDGAVDYVIIDNLRYALASPGAVPEPSTWAMMLLGFGVVGASVRRRKRTTLMQVA